MDEKSEMMLESAIRYRSEFNWSIVPSKDKRACVKWAGYQKEHPTIEQVKQWWGGEFKGANISLITGALSNVCVVDIDEHRVPGSIEYMDGITPDSLSFPCSRTPRGGQHRFFRHEEGAVSKPALPGVDIKDEGGMVVLPPSIGKNGNGKNVSYEWIIAPTSPVLLTLPVQYSSLLIKYNNRVAPDERYKALQSVTVGFEPGNQDNSLFTTAWHLLKAGMSVTDAEAIVTQLARSCDPNCDFVTWAQEKVKSASERKWRDSRNLAQDIKKWVEEEALQGVTFSVTDVEKALQIVTREERLNRRVTLHRMVQDGVLERDSSKAGLYRIVAADCKVVDWQSATPTPLDIKWPFGLENYVNLYPGNIVVLAGEQNSGKTAFLLNLVTLNQDKWPIHYFSSEMGPEEMKIRANLFGLPKNAWKFRFYERSMNFADVIRPDEINVIDFVEMHENFYEMSGILFELHNKLKNGIAVVALQKPPGRDVAKGGYGTLEKPRLYLALSNEYPGHRLKIIKAKNFVSQEVNPNGLSVTFRIHSGCKFSKEYKWERAGK